MTAAERAAMMDVSERLTRLETIAETTQKSVETMANAVTDLTKQMADVVATLNHPSREHCAMTEAIAETTKVNADHEARLRVIEGEAQQAKGALGFARWALGFLGVGNVALIITLLTQNAHHADKAAAVVNALPK
jgi:chromosome segregation ATPase